MRNSSVAAFFTNRALCRIKLQQWNEASADARRALELESNSIKGHFFLGQALLEMDHYEDAIKHIQKGTKEFASSLNQFPHLPSSFCVILTANDLAKEKKLNFGDEIAFLLRLAKKKRWNQIEEKRISEEIKLQVYLTGLIQKDRQEQLNALLQTVGVDCERMQEMEEEIGEKCEKYINEVNEMFNQLDIRRKVRLRFAIFFFFWLIN